MRLSNYTLTPTRINNAKARARLYKLSDGGGLFVEVSTTGQKTWRYQYRFAGSRRDVKIGRYRRSGWPTPGRGTSNSGRSWSEG